MNIFILILITNVNMGSVVSFQEFNSIESCNKVKELIKSKYVNISSIECVPK